MATFVRPFLAAIALAACLAFTAGASSVLAANDHSLPPDDVFVDVNPCTGLDTTITQHYTKAVFHESMDAQGGEHVTGTLAGEISTEDGFSGRFTIWFGSNDAIGGGDNEADTETFSATLSGPDGQKVVAHEVMHVTVVNGDVVVTIDKFSLECRGKPAA